MPAESRNRHLSDVVIIGGGIIGSSISLRLAQAKLKVCVLDRGEPGAEASSAAAGMIAPYGEQVEPDSFLELCKASHAMYADFVAEVEELSATHVGYRRDGTLIAALNEQEVAEIDGIEQSRAMRGFPRERFSGEEARRRLPALAPGVHAAIFIPQDHWVDNQLLTAAVISAARKQGVTFASQSTVRNFNLARNRVESVEVNGSAEGDAATFSAAYFILAAGCWSGELVRPLGISIPTQPCRGQMMEFETAGVFPWVVRAGKHYLVPRSEGRVVIGTTSEYVGFDKAVTGEGMRSLLEGAARVVPGVGEFKFRRAWAGLRPDTADHLPILGPGGPENLIFATGHFRNGILLAPVTAQLITELVLTGSTSKSIEAYRPTRFAPE
jgi:glycine oxidase